MAQLVAALEKEFLGLRRFERCVIGEVRVAGLWFDSGRLGAGIKQKNRVERDDNNTQTAKGQVHGRIVANPLTGSRRLLC